MTHSPFPTELRTASIIPRWSVVWTLNRDTVANHSFFVSLYSFQIAQLIGWQGRYGDLMYRALTHDLEENISGDLVSPVKRQILDRDKADLYLREKMLERMPSVIETLDWMEALPEAKEVKAIITAADRLDALLFLTVECRMGNRHVFSRCQDARSRLEEAWTMLPLPTHAPHDFLQGLWGTVVVPAIAEHESGGGSGV